MTLMTRSHVSLGFIGVLIAFAACTGEDPQPPSGASDADAAADGAVDVPGDGGTTPPPDGATPDSGGCLSPTFTKKDIDVAQVTPALA